MPSDPSSLQFKRLQKQAKQVLADTELFLQNAGELWRPDRLAALTARLENLKDHLATANNPLLIKEAILAVDQSIAALGSETMENLNRLLPRINDLK